MTRHPLAPFAKTPRRRNADALSKAVPAGRRAPRWHRGPRPRPTALEVAAPGRAAGPAPLASVRTAPADRIVELTGLEALVPRRRRD